MAPDRSRHRNPNPLATLRQVMILAGEYLEIQLAGAFHLSTMAAAGFGNLLSDVVGLGVGGGSRPHRQP